MTLTASEVNPFFTGSIPLHAAGMAVLPISRGDKRPLVASFNRWTQRPGRDRLDKWREKFPEANVGYVPGLTGRDGVVVIDDDGGAAAGIIDLFGKTPGMVTTRRGNHYLYRAPKGLERFNLKKFGINADVKMGGDIVVAPGSVHASGHVYAWDGCDARVMSSLPALDLRNLKDLIAGSKKAKSDFRDDSRGQGLNDYLCGQVAWVDSIEELIDVARTWNLEHLPKIGRQPLEDTEVLARAGVVFRDFEAGQLERWHGKRSRVVTGLDEFDRLSSFGADGSKLALPLLMKLRGEHSARTKRGETFSLNQMAMVRDQTIPGWSRYDYEKARTILLKAGFIEMVSEFKMTKDGRQGAQFRLV